MADQNSLKIGSFNVICDYCGFKFKAEDVRKTWDGLYACKKDWNPRQPQDFVRGVPDDQSTPFSRPEADDNFLTTNEVTPGSL